VRCRSLVVQLHAGLGSPLRGVGSLPRYRSESPENRHIYPNDLHTMRFVTSGVGGVMVGAGFVARGGVDGRSMMSNQTGDGIPKEQ
jgi:hypothetical protein